MAYRSGMLTGVRGHLGQTGRLRRRGPARGDRREEAKRHDDRDG
jgi:hypothetical protein